MEKRALDYRPPPSPNRDEMPFVATTNVQGLTIDLENLAGSVREGTDASGKKWRTKMRYDYGEIRKTNGSDKNAVDVYIGPNPQSKKVFIVHQNYPGNHPKKGGQYDEDKVMLGFNYSDEAKRGYLKQYDRKDFFRSITEMTMAQFKKSVFDENRGEKVAAVQPWSNAELAQRSTADPSELGRSFYTGAGAYQSGGASKDENEFAQQRQNRQATWDADPNLQEKWTNFMAQNPNWSPPQAPMGEPKMAALLGMTYDPNNQNIKKLQAAHGPNWKNFLAKKRGITSEQIQEIKSAAYNSSHHGAPPARKTPATEPDRDTLVNKLRRFSKSRKKDGRPSTFIRERMKVGTLHAAYAQGAKTAIASALLPAAPTAEKSTPAPGTAPKTGIKLPSPVKGAPPPASSGASSGAVQT